MSDFCAVYITGVQKKYAAEASKLAPQKRREAREEGGIVLGFSHLLFLFSLPLTVPMYIHCPRWLRNGLSGKDAIAGKTIFH